MHISIGTFKPVKTEDIESHEMDSERYFIEESEADKLNQARKNGKRIITVGTTSTRVVEHCFRDGKINAGSGESNLFIYPGYQFKAVDSIVTNFHMPKSSPFLLTCSFGGTELIKKAYRFSIENDFRFYSYGDSMLIL